MSLFARSKHNLEAMAVESLPFDQQLHLVVADADMNLQVLQFDPDSTFLLGGRWGAHYLAIFSILSLHLLFSLSPSLNNKSLTRHRSKISSWFPPAA